MRRLSAPLTLVSIAAFALAVGSGPSAVSAQSASAIVEDFTEERVGAPPSSFSTPTGYWAIGTDGVDPKPVLFVDGSKYSSTGPSNALAAQAQSLNLHQLADQSSALAYYPLAIFNKVTNFNQGTVVTRFAIVGGDLDTEAGIVFNYQPSGDFMALRVDADEDELELYSFTQGQPQSLAIIENVPATLARWHDLQLTASKQGTHLAGSLDGQKFIDVDLTGPISGRVGAMSKTDSTDVFNSFTVDPNGQ